LFFLLEYTIKYVSKLLAEGVDPKKIKEGLSITRKVLKKLKKI
jgi:DNA-binding CsgD family transcriptional regulator